MTLTSLTARTECDALDSVRAQHDALRRALEDVIQLQAGRAFSQAAQRYGRFRFDLENHLLTYEKVVLPLVLERSEDRASLSPLVSESRQTRHAMRDLTEAMSQALSQWNHDRFEQFRQKLQQMLSEHCQVEVRMLRQVPEHLLPLSEDWRLRCSEAQVTP